MSDTSQWPHLGWEGKDESVGWAWGEKMASSPGLGSSGEQGWVILKRDGFGWEMEPLPISAWPGHGEMSPHHLQDGGFP